MSVKCEHVTDLSCGVSTWINVYLKFHDLGAFKS